MPSTPSHHSRSRSVSERRTGQRQPRSASTPDNWTENWEFIWTLPPTTEQSPRSTSTGRILTSPHDPRVVQEQGVTRVDWVPSRRPRGRGRPGSTSSYHTTGTRPVTSTPLVGSKPWLEYATQVSPGLGGSIKTPRK